MVSWYDKLSPLITLCAGNPMVTSGFPTQRVGNAELKFVSFFSCWTNSQYASGLRHDYPNVMSQMKSKANAV